jgi:hypothetical protein
MPRGVPKSGFRRTKRWRKAHPGATVHDMLPFATQLPTTPIKQETDDEINKRIQTRFDIMSDLVDSVIEGSCAAMIVSGPAGLGKSFLVEEKLEEWDPKGDNYKIIKGYVRPTGLFKALYQCREGKVLVFDDADTIFFDDVSLNMLKAVCDTTEKRTVSYLAEVNMVDDESADVIPKSFEFKGKIIFISNYDFDEMILRGSKLAPHLQALMSRSYYVDLAMKTRRDCLIRIKQVAKDGLFDKMKLNQAEKHDVMNFIEDNLDSLRELSLRAAIKIAGVRKKKKHWESIAKITTCKQ